MKRNYLCLPSTSTTIRWQWTGEPLVSGGRGSAGNFGPRSEGGTGIIPRLSPPNLGSRLQPAMQDHTLLPVFKRLRCCHCLGMWVLCVYVVAAYYAYCHIFTYFFPHKLAFSTAILILFVFLLPISVRFRYLDHLLANRMAPSMCPDRCGTRWGSWFQAILYHISAAYLVLMRSAYFFKMSHKTDMPNCWVAFL